MDKIIFNNGYTKENIFSERRIIYFDIDSTLGGVTEHHSVYQLPRIVKEKRRKFNLLEKKLGIKLNFANYLSVSDVCLSMFLRTLKETNSVAFCISSWVTSTDIASQNTSFNSISLINEIFKSILPEWESHLVIGGCYKIPSERSDFCRKNIIPAINDYLIIDDSFLEYKDKTNLIAINSDCGYSYSNYKEIATKWHCYY